VSTICRARVPRVWASLHVALGTEFVYELRRGLPGHVQVFSQLGDGGPPADSKVKVPHHVSREEVLYVLSGTIQATVDGRAEQAAAGDVILVPAGAQFGVDKLGDRPATA